MVTQQPEKSKEQPSNQQNGLTRVFCTQTPSPPEFNNIAVHIYDHTQVKLPGFGEQLPLSGMSHVL
jgi:hypothetical protein